MLANMRTTGSTVKELIPGLTAQHMKAVGSMVSDMGKVDTQRQKEL